MYSLCFNTYSTLSLFQKNIIREETWRRRADIMEWKQVSPKVHCQSLVSRTSHTGTNSVCALNVYENGFRLSNVPPENHHHMYHGQQCAGLSISSSTQKICVPENHGHLWNHNICNMYSKWVPDQRKIIKSIAVRSKHELFFPKKNVRNHVFGKISVPKIHKESLNSTAAQRVAEFGNRVQRTLLPLQ